MARDLRADAARNRERVLAAARARLAGPDSPLSLAMNAVAREAGVGVGTVYRHFPSRQALLEAIAADDLEALADAAEHASADADPLRALEELVGRTLGLLAQNPGLETVLLVGAADKPETAECIRRLVAAMDALLGRARAAGAIRAEVGADDLRRLMCGLHHALAAGPDGASRVDLYASVLAAGLRPLGGARTPRDGARP